MKVESREAEVSVGAVVATFVKIKFLTDRSCQGVHLS
jgi:hypothetical protein